MKRIKNWSYEASSDIAAEKGAFPAFDADKFLRSGVLQANLEAELAREDPARRDSELRP